MAAQSGGAPASAAVGLSAPAPPGLGAPPQAGSPGVRPSVLAEVLRANEALRLDLQLFDPAYAGWLAFKLSFVLFLIPFAFAFDPALRGRKDLARVPVVRMATGPDVEERYLIDGNGVVTVEITDVTAGLKSTATSGRSSSATSKRPLAPRSSTVWPPISATPFRI